MKELKKQWNYASARHLCMQVEPIAKSNNCHVALTGGCLYKTFFRKDCDLLFYRVRQVESIDVEKLLSDLKEAIGIQVLSRHGWVIKCKTKDWKLLDLLFPEYGEDGDDYPQGD